MAEITQSEVQNNVVARQSILHSFSLNEADDSMERNVYHISTPHSGTVSIDDSIRR